MTELALGAFLVVLLVVTWRVIMPRLNRLEDRLDRLSVRIDRLANHRREDPHAG